MSGNGKLDIISGNESISDYPDDIMSKSNSYSGVNSSTSIPKSNGTNGVKSEALYNDYKNKEITTLEPVFEIESVQLQFDLNRNLTNLKVQNNIMFIVLVQSVFKIDLNNPSIVKSFEFKDSNITNCWLSPGGNHFIVQMNQSVYYYLHNSYDKFKILPKFKNLNLKNIVFPYSETVEGPTQNTSTGDILLVTNDDSILVANIKSHDQENKKDDRYVKSVYSCPKPIIDVCFTNNNSQINVITSNEIWQWDCFDNSYNELVKVFKTPPLILPNETDSKKITSLIVNNTDYLVLFSNNQIHSNSEILQQLGKLTEPSDSKISGLKGIMTKHHIIMINSQHDGLLIYSKLSKEPPKLLPLNLPHNEKVIGIVKDFKSSTFWLYSENSIYELIITNESVKIWYDYYKLGRYDEALKSLESLQVSNSSKLFQTDMIYIKQGYDYLQKGAFGIDYGEEEANLDLVHLQIKGIKILAQSTEPFEKICLMLMNLQTVNPNSPTNLVSERLLIEYLLVKFYYSKNVEKNHIRVIVLSSWIIELMLRVIYKVENEIKILKSGNLLSSSSTIDQRENILKDFNDQFYSFLNLNYKTFDAQTIYQIMHDLNYSSKLIFFADLNQDYEFILNHYIELEDWSNAIKILIKMYSTNFKNFEDIFYRKSTVLLVNHPSKTIETWLKFNDINYERLLPSLLIYNKQNHKISIFDNHSIYFLQKLIFNKKIKNKVIDNYYLSLLITYPLTKSTYLDKNNEYEENDPSKYINKQLVRFLNFVKYEKNLFDPGFILRLCLDYHQIQPAIIILINDMKLFEPALKLSLDHKLTDLSIFVLNKFNEFIIDEDEELEINDDFKINSITASDQKFNADKNKLQHKSYNQGKKLWITFAKYLINGVVEGQKFDFLDNYTESNDIEVTEDITEKDPIKSLTQEIVVHKESKIKVDSTEANKVLSYLLEASYCQPIGSNLLGLKDLLPLFPESIMVNNFKQEIINSLNQYNNNINQLSMEMKESLNISNNLSQQIIQSNNKTLKGKIFTIIEPGEPCKLCGKLLINKTFVSFPNCHHNFHKECLVKYYLMSNGDYRFKKIFQLYKRDNNTTNKKELDDIMVSECVLCNESNIISIDNNLIDPTKDKALISEWEI